MIRLLIPHLRRNLTAGFRVALLRPARRLDFRISGVQFAAVAVVATLCASLVDLAVVGGGARFSAAGLGGQVRDTAILLAICWGVAAALRAPGLALALPIVFLASGWFPDLLFAALIGLVGRMHGSDVRWLLGPAWWFFVAWSLLIAWRSAGIALQGERRTGIVVKAAVVAAVFGGTLAVALIYPSARLWDEPSGDAGLEAGAEKLPRVESEEVLAVQPRLLYEALSGLDERESGQQNVYFVGFASDASQDVFRNDMEAAQDVVDERLNTAGKSVVLINSPRTVLDTPLATLTNLRAALTTVGRLIDPDDDLAVIYLTSHGSADHQLLVNFPPLDLQQLSPTALARMLKESGIRWKVVIVSACYSGGYIEPLKDPNTIVIASSREDRTSFGCDNRSEFTYFGQAYFQEALKTTDSLTGAFDLARAAIARREKAEGLPSSEPQMFVGDAIRRKLESQQKPSTVALR